MSFGFGFGLPSWQPLSGGFNPSSLFVGGVQGVFFDPSDPATLFSDTAGTTPSPTPGAGALSVVGLMLDKSQGGVGTNGSYQYNRATYTQTFGTSWAKTNITITSTNNLAPDETLTATLLTCFGGTIPYFNNIFSTNPSTTNVCSLYVKAGTSTVFWLYFNAAASDGTAYFDLSDLTTQAVAGSSQTPANLTISNVGSGWYRISASWNNSQPTFNWGFGFCDAKGSINCTPGKTVQVWGFQLQSGTAPTTYQRIDANWYSTMAGNHAISYNTTTARPELSARVNLLTYSEQFDNPGWTKTNVTVTANAAVAPDGTTTADLLRPTATSGSGTIVAQAQTITGAQGTYNVSYRIKPSGFNWAIVAIRNIAGNKYIWQWFDLASPAVGSRQTSTFTFVSASIVPDTNGYYLCTLTVTTDVADSGVSTFVGMSDANNNLTATASGSNGLLVWGADLRPTNIGTAIPAYQRIADQYTYDSSGFPRYLVFNGTASGMYTPANLNLSGTDKVTVFSGVRKLSDAAIGVVCEFSANWFTTDGAFALAAPNTVAANYGWNSRGTVSVIGTTANSYAAPDSSVLAGSSVIGTDTLVLRRNGTQVLNVTSDQGTGNYGTYPLYIGSRNNGSLWFTGYLYSIIVVGAASTAAQISSTESWINVKEGGVY